MSNILELANKYREAPVDPEQRRLAAQKRAQYEQGAVELRALVSPLAGQGATVAGAKGVLHVRADATTAYVEFIPDEHYQAVAKFDGREVAEQRVRPGRVATARLALRRDAKGYAVAGFAQPFKVVATLAEVEECVAKVVGRILD